MYRKSVAGKAELASKKSLVHCEGDPDVSVLMEPLKSEMLAAWKRAQKFACTVKEPQP